MVKKFDYENTVKQLGEIIHKSGNMSMDIDECLDYADGIFNDLGAVGRAEFAGLLFIETEDTIQVKKQADGTLLLEIK